MEYKLIAIDMDDTLLSDELVLPKEVKRVITKAINKGVRVTIATGRMYSSALPYIQQLELDIPIITYNGALIKEAISGEVLYHRPVLVDLAKRVSNLAMREGWHLNIYLDDLLYVNKLGDEAKIYEEISGIKPILINGEGEDLLTDSPTKLLIVGEDLEQTTRILTKMDKIFGDRLNITRSKDRFVEIMQKGVSKGIALNDLAADFGIKREEVMAIGDSLNDLEMIEYSGLGVAVANASKEVKELADHITRSNEEGGVAEAISKFVLEG
jgi:hypothetical protein